jgi:MFS family permease
MPLLVFDATHSVVAMGRVTAVSVGGQLFTAFVSGAITDRAHRRYLMIGCDLARAALFAALPLLFALGVQSLGLIYAVAALAAVASNLFFVAYMAAVANLVEPEEVAPANGRLQATQALTYVAGSALAGIVCDRYGAPVALGINAASFLLSAASLARIRFRRDRAEQAKNEGALAGLVSGLAFLLRERVLRALAVFQTGVALAGSIGLGAAVIDLLVYRLKSDLRQGSAVVGATLACSALGAVVGAIGAARARRAVAFGASTVVGTGIQGLGLVLAGVGPGIAAVALGGVLWSMGLTFRSVAAVSLRQTLTPDGLLGRVVAAGWVMIFSASALGALGVTHLAAAIGTASALMAIGGFLVLISALGALSPLARNASNA